MNNPSCFKQGSTFMTWNFVVFKLWRSATFTHIWFTWRLTKFDAYFVCHHIRSYRKCLDLNFRQKTKNLTKFTFQYKFIQTIWINRCIESWIIHLDSLGRLFYSWFICIGTFSFVRFEEISYTAFHFVLRVHT